MEEIDQKQRARSTRAVYAVDLFCGAGGLTRGLLDAGIRVRAGVDLDPRCRFPYERNNGTRFIEKSVDVVKGDELKKYFRKGSLSLLAGCAPCQTFSSYNYKARSAENKDRKWFLLKEFGRLVQEILPDFVTMENVPGLEKQDVFEDFVAALKTNGYFVAFRVINCADYGVPQHRRRLVLLASKLAPIQLLSPEEYGATPQTVRDAISQTPPIRAGETCPSDPLHQCSTLSELNLQRIRSSIPGKTWREWSSELIASCHQKKSGRSYSGVYGRMEWDAPSPTITTQFYGFGNGRFGHPEQDRAISLREGAILQSFPQDYQFSEPNEPLPFKVVGRLIGNAVPVKIGEVVGKSVLACVDARQKTKNRKKRENDCE